MPNETPSRRKPFIQALLLLAALIGLAWRQQPDGRLHIFFPELDGDAALIQTPAGGFVLIDGGADPAALAVALGRRMPFWRRELDAVILTSADGRRLPGQVAALARYRSGLALMPPGDRAPGGATGREWRRLLDEQGAPVYEARAGQRLELGGATLRVLAVGEEKGAGLVLRLDYGATSAVLAHSAGEALASAPPPGAAARPAQLVAFPWELDPRVPLLGALRPGALLFSDGHHADRPALLTYTARGLGEMRLYHERVDGDVEWVSDGARAWVLTGR